MEDVPSSSLPANHTHTTIVLTRWMMMMIDDDEKGRNEEDFPPVKAQGKEGEEGDTLNRGDVGSIATGWVNEPG